jgi:hypothetical protein
MELSSHHPSHAYYYEMAPGFLENLWTPGLKSLPLRRQQFRSHAVLPVLRSFLVFIYKTTLILWSKKDGRA